MLGKSNLITIYVTHMQRHTHKGMESHQCICSNTQRKSINASAHSCSYSPFCVYVQVRNYMHIIVFMVCMCAYIVSKSHYFIFTYTHALLCMCLQVYVCGCVCVFDQGEQLTLSLLLSVTKANQRLNTASGDISLILYIERDTHTYTQTPRATYYIMDYKLSFFR